MASQALAISCARFTSLLVSSPPGSSSTDSSFSFFQIGSIVVALHDASDVFLEAAKVFKYSEKELGADSEDDE